MKISVVIPAFNEEEVIQNTLTTYMEFLSKNFKNFELIAVNDGSVDNTESCIRSVKDVICISYLKNRGKGYAVKRGVLRAGGDYIFFTDADLSYRPENILRAIEILGKNKVGAIAGIREKQRCDYPFLRRVCSQAFSLFVRAALPTQLPDTQCGFKGFDKETGKRIFSMLRTVDFGFDFEVVYLLQLLDKPVFELPVSFVHRAKSHVSPARDFLRAVKNMHNIKRSNIDELIKAEL